MKIAIDCRYIRVGHHDGISRFTVGIVNALAKLHPVTLLICDKRQLEELPAAPYLMLRDPTSIFEPFVARRVNRVQPDVVFTPMQTMGSWGRRYRLILTVHDLIYYTHRRPPRSLPLFVRALWRLYHLAWWPQRVLLNRADLVATVSKTTADEIARKHLTRRPVVVVPNAADSGQHVVTQGAVSPRDKTLVYMGSFMPYKNVRTLVQAMELLPDYTLHLLSPINEREKGSLQAAASTGSVVFHNGVTDEQYEQFLQHATALVTASKAEGFGLPLIEAMRHGTPVAVSDIPIFHEIGADAATFFDPDRPEAIAAAVRHIESCWDRVSSLSRQRARHFAWANSARILLDAMQKLASPAANQIKQR